VVVVVVVLVVVVVVLVVLLLHKPLHIYINTTKTTPTRALLVPTLLFVLHGLPPWYVSYSSYVIQALGGGAFLETCAVTEMYIKLQPNIYVNPSGYKCEIQCKSQKYNNIRPITFPNNVTIPSDIKILATGSNHSMHTTQGFSIYLTLFFQ
jgi:hypothetical protein